MRVQLLVNGVAGAGMVQLEAQQLGGGQAVAAAAQGHAGGGELFSGKQPCAREKAGARAASQASNSGAGLRPSTLRKYSAS